MALPATAPAIDVQRIADRYVLADDQAVMAFLADRSFLIPLLIEAREQLVTLFGPEAPVVLELTTDPEEGDTELFARVQTPHPVRASLDRLDDFFDRWWVKAIPSAGGLLHFDVE